MKYDNIFEGIFISRPNRFIAEIEIDGKLQICHVKNTGRCKELLVKGARVFVCKSDNPGRKTAYDLISVYKGDKLINMDSQAPNKVFGEWISQGNFFKDVTLIKPECKYNNSRFDFYIETLNEKIFVEVKGVTLEEDGVVMFPDAPTQRGVKHIRELISAVRDGYKSYIFFVAQMEHFRYFTPNSKTHSEFADTLRMAREQGVGVYCVSCNVTKNELNINKLACVKL